MKSKALLLLCALTSASCREDKPYTPYKIETKVAASDSSSAAAPVDSNSAKSVAPAFERRSARLAPERAETWQIDGTDLVAPKGRLFERAVVMTDEQIIAWTIKAQPELPSAAGELWLFRKGGPVPRRLLALPTFIPTGPGCTLTADLAQTGPASATLDVSADCKARLVPRTPTRAIVVVTPAAPDPRLVELRLAAPAPGEKVDVNVTSTDRDGDGLDDGEIRLTLSSEGSDKTSSASLFWYQRPGHASRDAGEPAESLYRQATGETVRAKSKKSALSAPRAVANLRRLIGFVCAEGGVPRAFDGDGNPLRCGDLTKTLDNLVVAEVTAALTSSKPSEAAAALERAGWYFGRLSEATRTTLEKSIDKLSKPTLVRESSVAARPLAAGSAPHLSPLAFDTDGRLLVQTEQGVLRYGAADEELPHAEDAPVRWPLASSKWSAVSHGCDRSEILLTGAGGELPIPVLSARPGPCARGSHAPSIQIVMADVEQPLFVAGSLVVKDAPPFALGSGQSPDGKSRIVPSALGLWVTSGSDTERWAASEPATLRDCVIANGAGAAACISAGKVRVFRRGP